MADDLKIVKRCVFCIFNQFDYEKKELNTKALKELKVIIRRNEAVIPNFVGVLFEHLRRENSDSRLAIILLVNYFFQRSHKFRVEIVNLLQDFALLTLETDPLHFPLPGPPAAAAMLKKHALETTRCWVEKFGDGYPKLRNAERFFATSKHFDFKRSNTELLAERNRSAQEQFQKEFLARKILAKCQALCDENFDDIQKSLTECRNLLELLFPRFCDKNSVCEDKKLVQNASLILASESRMKQLHGYLNDNVINVVLPADGRIAIKRSSDTIDLLNSLRDCCIQLESYMHRVTKWLKKIIRVGPISAEDGSSADVVSTSSANSLPPNLAILTKKLVEIKADLKVEIERCGCLKMINDDCYKGNNSKINAYRRKMDEIYVPKKLSEKQHSSDDNSDGSDEGTNDKRKRMSEGEDSEDGDDFDFIDVDEKEGLELDLVAHEDSVDDVIPHHILNKIRQNEAVMKVSDNDAANQPGPSGLQKSIKKSEFVNCDSAVSMDFFNYSSSVNRMAEENLVPKLAFGLDLKYWGKTIEPAERYRNQFDGHRFWRAPDNEDSPVLESADSYSNRLITFVGQMPKIRRTCRAPLSNGRLCPRMDRYRCPVHGLIVARDAVGLLSSSLPQKEEVSTTSFKKSSTFDLKRKSKCNDQDLDTLFGGDEFLRDVEGAAGAVLTSGKTKLMRKKRRTPAGLQLRDRLTTKLFDKRTIRRVTQTMDAMQKARAERKFAHQFSYALNNKRS